MKSLYIALLIFCCSVVSAQQGPLQYARPEPYGSYIKEAEIELNNKNYAAAASKYSKAFESLGWRGIPIDRYKAAIAWSLAGNKDSSFFNLIKLANSTETELQEQILNSKEFHSLYTDKRWQYIVSIINPKVNKSAAIRNSPLAATLDSLLYKDQMYRNTRPEPGSAEERELTLLRHKQDSLNVQTVMAFLDTYGWMGPEDVGQNASNALFLVIQHAPLQVQQKYLPILREAAKLKKIQAGHVATLEDRILVLTGKPQLYGTQLYMDRQSGKTYFFPISEPEKIEERRAQVGLPPYVDYLKAFNLTWSLEEYNRQLPLVQQLINQRKQ